MFCMTARRKKTTLNIITENSFSDNVPLLSYSKIFSHLMIKMACYELYIVFIEVTVKLHGMIWPS